MGAVTFPLLPKTSETDSALIAALFNFVSPSEDRILLHTASCKLLILSAGMPGLVEAGLPCDTSAGLYVSGKDI